MKTIWNGIEEIINIKHKSLFSPSSLKGKDRILINHKDLANNFNSYFFGIADNILINRKCEGKHTYKKYQKNPLQNPHTFFECDPPEVECLITVKNPITH